MLWFQSVNQPVIIHSFKPKENLVSNCNFTSLQEEKNLLVQIDYRIRIFSWSHGSQNYTKHWFNQSTLRWVGWPYNLVVGWWCLSGIAWLLRGSIPLLRGWSKARFWRRCITLVRGWSIYRLLVGVEEDAVQSYVLLQLLVVVVPSWLVSFCIHTHSKCKQQ